MITTPELLLDVPGFFKKNINILAISTSEIKISVLNRKMWEKQPLLNEFKIDWLMNIRPFRNTKEKTKEIKVGDVISVIIIHKCSIYDQYFNYWYKINPERDWFNCKWGGI